MSHNEPTDPGQGDFYLLTNPRHTAMPPTPPAGYVAQPTKPMKKGFRGWYQRQHLLSRIAIICLTMFFITVICAFSMGMSAARQAESHTLSPTPTQIAHSISTPQPTPTMQPTPEPATPTPELATPTPTPATPTPAAPTPTSTPVNPTPTPSIGVNGNPWGYNYASGKKIYTPPQGFCKYFDCISSFWNGQGYVVECQDGMYTMTGGTWGSCAWHGGNKQILYSH